MSHELKTDRTADITHKPEPTHLKFLTPLFWDAYLNKFTNLWCPVTENTFIWGVHHFGCLETEAEFAAETMWCVKKLGDWQSHGILAMLHLLDGIEGFSENSD